MKKRILSKSAFQKLCIQASFLTGILGASEIEITRDDPLSIPILDLVQTLEPESDSYYLECYVTKDRITAKSSSYTKGEARDYFRALTSKEKDDITFIIKTLANDSHIKIGKQQKELNKAGDRIRHLHPLKFYQFVFTNQELIVCMRNLEGKFWVWKEYLNGVVESLRDENQVGNLKVEYLYDLAAQIQVDVNALLPSFQSQNYAEFVHLLIALVPRQGDSKRYDM